MSNTFEQQKIAEALDMISTITESLNKTVTVNKQRSAKLDKREEALAKRQSFIETRERGVAERERLVSAREKSVAADITKSTTPTVTTDGRPDTVSVDVLPSEVSKTVAVLKMAEVGYALQTEESLSGGQVRLGFKKTDVFAIPTNAMPGKWKV